MTVYRRYLFPQGFPAVIKTTNTQVLKNRCYWNDGEYENAFYIYVSMVRPQFEINRELSINEYGAEEVVFQSKTELVQFEFVANSPILDYISSLGFHDVVTLTHLEQNQTITLSNITFTDNTSGIDQGVVRLQATLSPVIDRKCADNLTLISCS